MDKQTTLAFVFIGIILVVWMYFNAPEPQKMPPANTADSTLVQNDSNITKDTTESPAPVVEETQRDSSEDSGLYADEEKEEEVVTIDNDVAKLELTE